jgi:SAM-dependent methyltransferase
MSAHAKPWSSVPSDADTDEPRCPICDRLAGRVDTCYRVNTLPSERLAHRHEEPLRRCDGCGFWWISPPPDLSALVDAYRDTPEGHWGDAGSAGTALARGLAEKAASVVARVPGGRALDVGCFHGDLLLALPDSFERAGIELSRAAATVARARGIEVLEGDAMTAVVPAHRFDVIFCMDVIEHVVDQHAFAARVASWLAPDGLLVIETGDTRSVSARLMGARWHYLSLVEHVCAHSRESLNRLMSAAGLQPVEVRRRWHTRPANMTAPLSRWALAGAFRLATAALDAVHSVAPLPRPLDQLRRRYAPWHPAPDHLFAIYALPGSRHLVGVR